MKRFNVTRFKLGIITFLLVMFLAPFVYVICAGNYAKAYAPSDSPMTSNLFSINSLDINQTLYPDCPKIGSTPAGALGDMINVFNELAYGARPTEIMGECISVVGTSSTNTVSYGPNIKNKGLLAAVGGVSEKVLEEKPLSSKVYLDQQVYALKNFGTANAQSSPDALYYPGTGFSLLKPVQEFWGWSVSIVYGLMIFVIIGVAFAIMFRANLSGAASITIQTAIPNIALAMILIPLSYAISGVFIDTVTVGTNVVRNFMIGEGAPGRGVFDQRATTLTPEIPDNDPNDRGLYPDDKRVTWLYSFSGTATNVGTTAEENLPGLVAQTPANTALGLVDSLVQTVGLSDANADDGQYDWIGDIIGSLLAVLFFFTSLRILKRLLTKYAVFLITPILAPFAFATIAIPGNGTKSIMQFVKTMGAAALFYIVTYAMFLLALVLSSSAFQDSIPDLGKSSYVPPLLGFDTWLQGASGSVFESINAFMFAVLAVMIYLNIPSTLDSIDESLGTNKMPFMEFVNNAVSSGSQSINMARRAYNNATFKEGSDVRNAWKAGKERSAAALGEARRLGGGLVNVARLPGDIAYGADDYRKKGLIRAKRAIDFMANRESGSAGSLLKKDYDTAKNRLSTVDREITGLKAQLADVNPITNPVKYAAINAGIKMRISEKQQLGRRIASTESALADDGKKRLQTDGKLEVDITWGPGPLPIIIDQGVLLTLASRVRNESNVATQDVAFKNGKIVFKVSGFTLPPTDTLKYFGYFDYNGPAATDIVEYRTKGSKGATYHFLGGGARGALVNLFKFGTLKTPNLYYDPTNPARGPKEYLVDDLIAIELESSNPAPTENGINWECRFSLVFKDVRGFLNTANAIDLWETNKVAFAFDSPFGAQGIVDTGDGKGFSITVKAQLPQEVGIPTPTTSTTRTGRGTIPTASYVGTGAPTP